MGFSKVSVQLKSRAAANSLINNQILKTKNLCAFIPSFRIQRQGIIRNIPLDISEEEIKKEFNSPFDIISVRRLNRRSTSSEAEENTIQYIPTRSISLKFNSQNLPKYVFLYMVRYEINPFVSKVPSCTSCYRYGHIKAQCKGFPRCSHCADRAHEGNSPCPFINFPPVCINCKGSHKSGDPTCSELFTQKQIRHLAASKNLPFLEAKKIIRNSRNNLSNPQFDFSKFPELNDSPTPDDSLHSSSFGHISPQQLSLNRSYADAASSRPVRAPSSSIERKSPNISSRNNRIHSSFFKQSSGIPAAFHGPLLIAPHGNLPQAHPDFSTPVSQISFSPSSGSSPTSQFSSANLILDFQSFLTHFINIANNLIEKFASPSNEYHNTLHSNALPAQITPLHIQLSTHVPDNFPSQNS